MGLRFTRVGAAVIATALVTQLYSFQYDDDARSLAWTQARRAIRASAEREIPEFLTWAQPTSIYPCRATKGAGVRRMDFSESLFFNPIAAARMCGNLDASGSTRLETGAKAWQHEPEIQPFESGSVLAAAFWYPLSRPKDPELGSPFEIRIRKAGQKDDIATRKIRILIPESLRNDVAGCPLNDSTGTPAQPGMEDVSLEEFYWIRLKSGESYQTATCGDFAILVGFHLVHKVEAKGWLWSTFWWDDSRSEPFGSAPATFTGAGDYPDAWLNYAMDAAFGDPGKVIYNPWRDSEVANRNCAACHQKLATIGESPQSTLTFDMVITARVHF